MKSPKKVSEHYVDNKKLYEAMREYIDAYRLAKENDTPLPKISNYIGECIVKIATRRSLSLNFINYSFRSEMISDGIEDCIKYLHNFNPDKYNNPFAYFTTVVSYAFIRRIQKEEKNQYIKNKALMNSYINNMLVQLPEDDTQQFRSMYTDMGIDTANEYIEQFEAKIRKKKEKKEESNE